MFLTRIIYTSTITEKFSVKDVDDILDEARSNNRKKEITGMLCFSRNYHCLLS